MNNPKELEFHIEGLMENGEDVPEWLKNGDYEFVYNITSVPLKRDDY